MTAGRFWITGLPRSRTAWMSAFCSTGNSICYHEPIRHIRRVSDLQGLYSSEFYKHVGFSDSGLGFFIDQMIDLYQPKILVIERDPADVEKSLQIVGIPPSNYLELLMDRLRVYKDHPLVMWVPFEALNSKRVMQKIFWHLMPGEAFDESRYDELAKMQIQVFPHLVYEMAEKSKITLAELMKDVRPLIRLKENAHAA